MWFSMADADLKKKIAKSRCRRPILEADIQGWYIYRFNLIFYITIPYNIDKIILSIFG